MLGGSVRRLPIRFKLVGALAVPLLCLLAVVVAEVVGTSREVHRVLDQSETATAAIGPSGLMTGLQDERNWAAVELIGQQGLVNLPVTGYEETRQRTDAAISEFIREVQGKGGAVADAYGPALDNIHELQQLREDIDASKGPRDITNNVFADEMFTRYARLITPFQDGNTRLALVIDDPDLRRGVELVDVTSRQIECSANLLRAIIQSQLDGTISREDVQLIASLSSEYARNVETIQSAKPPYSKDVADGVPREFDEQVTKLAVDTIHGKSNVVEALDVAAIPVEDTYNVMRDDIARRLRDEAKESAAEADRTIGMLRALAAAAVLIAGLATWIVSRSITSPLRSLTRQATDMASHRLPEAVVGILETPLGDDVAMPQVQAVNVTTKDEVSDVADALNTVQSSALGLAVEQAVLRRNIADSFVNLGRRNQNLLSRQLNFITELEANETDPDTLANLFRLDHLATRMRRNAESLLLLAGVDPPRTWSQPVRVNDVIRAALGEVEDYQRVVDRGVEPATIHGSAAADLAHLLAELIDNALVYSPPDQAVEVRGGRRSTAMGGGAYTLAVIDAGLGMRPDELARANQRPAGAESFTIAPSKYLGHYVAGHLAARHSITVSLHSSPGGGVTAVTVLPESLLVEPAAPIPPAMPAPLSWSG